MRRFRATKKPIARYLFLRDLQLFNPRVYFHMLMTRTEELLPFIYTPTVGEACQTYHELPMLTQVGSGTQPESTCARNMVAIVYGINSGSQCDARTRSDA
jgi:malic enzyme